MDIDDFADPYEIPNKDNEWEETVAVSRKTDIPLQWKTSREIKIFKRQRMTAKLNAIGMLIKSLLRIDC